MPLYEYTCSRCDRRFEDLVSASGPAPACPHCDSADGVERVLTAGVALGTKQASGPNVTRIIKGPGRR